MQLEHSAKSSQCTINLLGVRDYRLLHKLRKQQTFVEEKTRMQIQTRIDLWCVITSSSCSKTGLLLSQSHLLY